MEASPVPRGRQFDLTSSMTAVVKVDLKAQYPNIAKDFVLDDTDLLAAFSGDICLGVTSPDEGLFYLYIGVPIGVTPSSVTLRYYSAHYKNLFEHKDAFPYLNDECLGTCVITLRIIRTSSSTRMPSLTSTTNASAPSPNPTSLPLSALRNCGLCLYFSNFLAAYNQSDSYQGSLTTTVSLLIFNLSFL